ncbi:hypothetical protein NF212_22400 [Parasalinivibrio latis]|uniref:hypothetical protein n=1 Tax=Parasalinivibrio latis TaxID=2952610 RepID=UPI0030E097BB
MNVNTLMQSPALFRSPEEVMAPDRLGAMHQTRISFVRTLIRRMAKENWQVTQNLWDISPQGFGTAIYRLQTPDNVYHLVVFSDAIKDEERNDRVIAEKWDVTFALVKGEISESDLTQLRDNVPLQEAGRNSSRVLVLARANKSVRVFEHVVTSLAQGHQPDPNQLANVGYILRTTAVYGNGKFGIADFETLDDNPDFNLSFSAQMCAVYILRQFSLDWVHALARHQGGDSATTMSEPLQRYLGVGNATGLGMAPYLIKHPCVVDQWLSQREAAVTSVASQPVDATKALLFSNLARRAQRHLSEVVTIDEEQHSLNIAASGELQTLLNNIPAYHETGALWGDIIIDSRKYGLETQEIVLSCILELYPDRVDSVEKEMNTSEELSLDPGITLQQMCLALETHYRWAIDTDFSKQENRYWFWYRSQDKEEPRLGVRGVEQGEERELPLDIGRQVNTFYHAITQQDGNGSLAAFLLAQPQYRAIARRCWTLSKRPMGEIQMNVLAENSRPMDLLRCKLAMFGATKFDPRSDRWVRVTLFQGAPLTNELHEGEWLFPLLPQDGCEKNTREAAQ